MKKLILVLMVIGIAACHRHSYITGPQGKAGKDGVNGIDGAVGATGATGSSGATGAAGANGSNGSNGTNGVNGLNGHSMASRSSSADSSLCANGGNVLSVGLDINDDSILQDSEISSVLVACNGLNGSVGATGATGSTGAAGATGATGAVGATGANGTNGVNGMNGAVGATGATGATGAAGINGTNGTNGTNGSNAPPTAFTPVAIINPCGDAPGIYDEVFMKLNNGMVIASFSDNANGNNTRFSLLTAGTYQTTDGDSCVFTIDSSGTITYENHHYN